MPFNEGFEDGCKMESPPQPRMTKVDWKKTLIYWLIILGTIAIIFFIGNALRNVF